MKKETQIKIGIAISVDQKRALIYLIDKSTEDRFKDNFFYDNTDCCIYKTNTTKKLLSLGVALYGEYGLTYALSHGKTSLEITSTELKIDFKTIASIGSDSKITQ